MSENLKNKIRESIASIMPITVIVALICFFITPVSIDTMMLFVIGTLFLIIGMAFFSLGAETSMSLIGERIGANLSKSKNIWVISLIAFIVGTIITIAEPDLQVLATQITEVPNLILIGTVGIGVGIFLAIAMLRIVFKIKLSKLLLIFYLVIFCASFFIPQNFLPIAFDSGGVTTGPLTVPFIIALGIGAASIRNDKSAESDSFGLVALCSIGPIIAVMVLGLLYKITNTEFVPFEIQPLANSQAVFKTFSNALPNYCLEVLKSLSPIVVFFILYQIFCLKLSKSQVIKIFVGFIYTFIGLVIFLTGVNVGFLPVGNSIGYSLMNLENKIILIPIMILIGFFIVQAEPAVLVLIKQVSNITDGVISEKLMKTTLSIGMAIALTISFIRAWLGIPIYYFLIPGYLLALLLMFLTPEIFTGIAFDSGGVTSRTNDGELLITTYDWNC